VLTGTGGRTSKRSLIVRFTVSGQVPCSGAERRSKVLDEVSTAILGGAAAENVKLTSPSDSLRQDRQSFRGLVERLVGRLKLI